MTHTLPTSFMEALIVAFRLEGIDPALAVVVPCEKPELADFQCNGAFIAGRDLKKNPRALAQAVVDRMGDPGCTVAGPGYINIKLTLDQIIPLVSAPWASPRPPKNIVIDFGGPNVAKSMHVGHLRSLVIGDALQRILKHDGHYVTSDIHLGDWGLQMGLLTAALIHTNAEWDVTLPMLEEAYPAASARAKLDPEFRKAAQRATVAIQNPMWTSPEKSFWQAMVKVSVEDIQKQLKVLGITFDLFERESTVKRLVPEMIQHLLELGLAVESHGAVIVPSPNENDPPMILRNSEGGYLYAATDLATIAARESMTPAEVIYVVDQRQALHFKQVFALVQDKLAHTKLIHAGFGTINGTDGKPLKTRDGGVPKLADLIHQTYLAAHAKNPESITRSEKIGLAALKFADLMNPRESSYTFDPDKFVNFEGKTGPYILYQCVRIKSILREAISHSVNDLHSIGEEERDLAFKLAYGFPMAMERAVEKLSPKEIADYTYELAQMFSKYYGKNTIADNKARLALIQQVGERLETCLYLLGITVPDRM